MISNKRIVVIVAQASALFALSVLFLTFVVQMGPSEIVVAIKPNAGAIVYIFPNAVGGWWIYRSIKSFYPRPEAIVSAIAFAVCSLPAFFAGTIIAELTRGGSETAILTGILAMMAIMFLISSTVLLFIFRNRL